MPRIPGKTRPHPPPPRDIPLDLKVLLLRLHRKVGGIRGLLHALFDPDPWALLGRFRIRNWTPIHHEPNTSEPHLGAPSSTGTYVVRHVHKAIKRKVIDVSEPLGPEDLELGQPVDLTDVTPDPELVRILEEQHTGPRGRPPAG
jgi:hypothetical protein